MPDSEKLKKFSSIVRSFGSEPLISKERSEAADDVHMGEGEELPSDLSSLIDAVSAIDEQPQEEGIEEYGSIDDIALDNDLRKDVTPDLLTIDESEGGIGDFGEGTDQIDLGEGESPDFDVSGIETPVREKEEQGGEDFSLPDDFSFGEEASIDSTTPTDTAGGEDVQADFTLPDQFDKDTGLQQEEPGETAIPEGEGVEFESFDLGTESEPAITEEEGFTFEEEKGEPGGEEVPLDNLEFEGEGEAPQEGIGQVSGFEGIGEGFELPESLDESFEAGGAEEEQTPLEVPDEFVSQIEHEVEEESIQEPQADETPAPEGEEEFVIDQLGELELPDMGEQAESFEEQPVFEEKPGESKKVETLGRKRGAPEDEGRIFSDREFAAIQSTLSMLPRNLKLKVEAAIGKSIAKGEALTRLISLLIRGAHAPEIATLVTQITGEQIVIPKQFEKKTGFAYEEEKRSFRYVLRANILPLLTIMIPMLLTLGLLVFIGIRASSWFEAQSHYNKGLEYITTQKRFAEGNKEFDLGYNLASDNYWFYKYAEAFVRENQYADAQDKYEQLLALRWKGERIELMGNVDAKGILDYAAMESKILTNYKKADTLLASLIMRETSNKDAILARGDNYLEWADSQSFKFEMETNGGAKTKPETVSEIQKSIDELYESGRLAYAEYKNRFNDTSAIKFKFLHYFIRTDKLRQAEELKDAIQANTDIKVDPLVYAELGGYLIDKNELLDVRAILNRAIKENPSVPEIHYHYARYLDRMDQKEGEEGALKEAITLLDKAKPLSMKRIIMLIDSHNKLGRLYFITARTQEAETELEKAIRMIENPEQKALFGINPQFGEVYYNRANILYDTKDFTPALDLYTKAKAELYGNPDMDYKLGYINYRNRDHDAALLDFYNTEQVIPDNLNTLYAIGNTLFAKDDYFAAQGYFEHLIQVLEKTKSGITSLRPALNPVHLGILNLIMRAYNNLGITMKRLAEKPRNPGRESEALALLTRSQEYYDLLERSMYESGTAARDKLKRNLAYLNQRAILYPVPGYDLYIYQELPTDPETTYIDDLFSTKVKL